MPRLWDALSRRRTEGIGGTHVYNVKNKRVETAAKDEERTRTGEPEQDVRRNSDPPRVNRRDMIADREPARRTTSFTRLRTEVTIDEGEASDSNDQTWSEWWQS